MELWTERVWILAGRRVQSKLNATSIARCVGMNSWLMRWTVSLSVRLSGSSLTESTSTVPGPSPGLASFEARAFGRGRRDG